MADIILLGGGNRPKSETRYFNVNFESHRGLKVYFDGRLVPDCLEADVNCSLVRMPDPHGKRRWCLGDEIIKTTLSIGAGFVEIKE